MVDRAGSCLRAQNRADWCEHELTRDTARVPSHESADAAGIHHFTDTPPYGPAMARPKVYEEQRITTAVRFPESLHDELKHAAENRDVSVNWLVNRAVSRYLAELQPAE